MSMISYALKGNMKNFMKRIDKVSKTENISKIKLYSTFLSCLIHNGFGYSDFLDFKLYNKTKSERNEYASIKDEDKFYEIVSPSAYKKFFTIKPDFLKNFQKYISRDFYYDTSIQDLREFLKNNKSFMIKPIDGLGGHGVEKLEAKDINNIEEFFIKLKEERLLLEGYVVQHDKLQELCSTSCNTIRIMTYGYGDHSEILFAALRVGNGTANVDNFHQGGMAILVDLETGKLVGNAVDKNLKEYEEHPQTKIKFNNFQIPNWDIVKKTVLEAAKVNEHIHVVGWDVAVTNKGCTFIEGNRRPGFDIVQVTSKRGRKDIMRHVIEELNKEEGTKYKI